MQLRRLALHLPMLASTIMVAGAFAMPATSSARASAARTYIAGDCVHTKVKPTTAILYCGDANQFVTGLTWQRWGQPVAEAHGTLNTNSCDPNCAAGKDLKATAVLTVTDPKPCGASHRRQYTKWAITVLGTPPKGVQPNSNGSFLCR